MVLLNDIVNVYFLRIHAIGLMEIIFVTNVIYSDTLKYIVGMLDDNRLFGMFVTFQNGL